MDSRSIRLIPVLLGLVAFAAVAATIHGPGPVWDEPPTIIASDCYIHWLAEPSLSREAIDHNWKVNHEHPPLAKLGMGIVRRAVQWAVPGMPYVATSRLFTAMAFGVLVGLVSAFAMNWGPAAGVAAGLFALFMPRLFAHAHFATLDMLMALMWFATAYAFSRGIKSNAWAAFAGVLFGKALLTKINAVFIPVPLIIWVLVFHRKKALVPIACLGIGAAVFFIGWPWLWHDTFGRLQAYFLGTTLERFAVQAFYLGRVYTGQTGYAPWHYPFVLTLFTVPSGVLTCFALGVWSIIRKVPQIATERGRSLAWLAAINAAAILVVAALPIAPKYDGVRLFLPLFPFIACLAGLGFQRLWDWWGARRFRAAAAGVFIAAQAAGIIIFHPYETSCYNLLCGSLPGAKAIGLETTYWCDVYSRPVFDFVNALPPGTRVAFYPVGEFMEPVYRADGYLANEIRYVDFAEGDFDYAVLMNRQGMLRGTSKAAERAREMFEKHPEESLLTVKRLGVPLCVVKRRESP